MPVLHLRCLIASNPSFTCTVIELVCVMERNAHCIVQTGLPQVQHLAPFRLEEPYGVGLFFISAGTLPQPAKHCLKAQSQGEGARQNQ